MSMTLEQAIAWLDRQTSTVFDKEVYDRDVQPVLCEAHGLLRAVARQPMTYELNDRVKDFLAATDPKCRACGTANPYLTPAGVCQHRRACEARQMLRSGSTVAAAADHAQRPPSDDSGGSVFWW